MNTAACSSRDNYEVIKLQLIFLTLGLFNRGIYKEGDKTENKHYTRHINMARRAPK